MHGAVVWSRDMNDKALMGIFMVVGAVIWFVVGYFNGLIFFYPPALALFGVIRIWQGLREPTA